MTRTILTCLSLYFCCLPILVQSQSYWTAIQESSSIEVRKKVPDIHLEKYLLFQLNERDMEQYLRRQLALGHPFTLYLPLPDGSIRPFEVEASRNLPRPLAKKYPNILSFVGHGASNPANVLRGSLSTLGFHAVIQIDNEEIYIDPLQKGNRIDHLVYRTSDHLIDPELRDQIGHDHSHFETPTLLDNPLRGGPNSPFIKNRSSKVPVALFQYDIAIAATGEYTQFWGGKEEALSAINVALDRINFIFVRDAAIELRLVAQNDTLIFENPAADPYTGDEAGTLVGENPSVLNQRLGASAYDIGHVFTRGCSGSAVGVSGGVGTVCGTDKARGSSCQIATNDRFYIGIICHELGHQFGAFHTWNNCPPSNDDAANYNPIAAFEPGSGSTIMSYAGSCQDQNIANDSDPYYHVNSIEAIFQYAREGVGAGCAETLISENNQPEVTIPYNDGFFIPISTPFKLSATASDPDGDVLSYCWEQYDKDFFLSKIGEPEGNDPIFRSFLPSESPTRYLPRLSDLLQNRSNDSEVLPTYSRDLTFRCTVRDNNEMAGGVAWKELRFRSTREAGPFVITTPNDSRLRFPGGKYLEITWDVANTEKAPVNCQFVNIRLSLDAGLTYPILLAQNTPNDGSAFVHLPDTTADFARLMIEAADNIFFDINDFNFEIVPAQDTSLLVTVNPSGIPLHCQPEPLSFRVNTSALNGFEQPLTLELLGALPEGAQYKFSPNPVLPGESSQLSIDLPRKDATELKLEVLGTTVTMDTFRRPIFFSSLGNRFDSLSLETPVEGANDILLSTDFSWTAAPNVDAYDVEIATSPAFGPSIVESATNVRENVYQPSNFFANNKLYFWRIRPINACGPGPYLQPATFHTASIDCSEYKNDTRVNISGTGKPTILSTIEVTDEGIISDLNIPFIRANYQPVNSLRISLISPAETKVVLFDQNCGATVNLRMGFDDDAPNEIACPPDDAIVFQPVNPLSAFIGENTQGTWTLEVAVVGSGFGASGALEEWQLEFCALNQPTKPELSTRDTLRVPPAFRNSISPNELKAIDPNINDNELLYTLVSLPQFGTLVRGGEALQIGSQFKQRAIDNLEIQYLHNAADNTYDEFSFVIENGLGGFIPITTLPIVIDGNAVVSTSAPLSNPKKLVLYPNPATEMVWLDLSYLQGAVGRVDLISAQGQLLRRYTKVEGQKVRLNLRGLSTGLYLVRVQDKSGNSQVTQLQVSR